MLKVLIVDDEAMIRKGLNQILDWNALNMNIIGSAKDGEEGLLMIKELGPDIVLTDIKMPHKNGLDMIEECAKAKIEPYFVVLTGFDEFDYAKRALKNQVLDYLLKPIDESELKKVMIRIKQKIEKREERTAYIQVMERKLSENLPTLREKFIGDFILGNLAPHQINNDNFEFYDIHLRGTHFKIILIEADDIPVAESMTGVNKEKDRQLTKLSLIDITNDLLNKKGIHVLTSTYGEQILVVAYGYNKQFHGLIEALHEVHRTAKRVLGNTITFGISTTGTDINLLSVLYRESKAAMNYKLYEGRGSIINYSELDIHYKSVYAYPEEQVRILINAISDSKEDMVYQVLDEIFHHIRKFRSLPPNYVYRMCTEILFGVRKALDEIGVDMDKVVNEDILSYSVISRYQTLDDLSEWFKGIFNQIMDYCYRRKTNTSNDSMDHILLYLKSNYQENITLDLISKKFFIEPSYFCKIFKKVTNETYLSFLTRIRIEKAADLLKNPDVKVYEVSERVGYDNQRYFSQIFKKKYGITPSEYKEKHNTPKNEH